MTGCKPFAPRCASCASWPRNVISPSHGARPHVVGQGLHSVPTSGQAQGPRKFAVRYLPLATVTCWQLRQQGSQLRNPCNRGGHTYAARPPRTWSALSSNRRNAFPFRPILRSEAYIHRRAGATVNISAGTNTEFISPSRLPRLNLQLVIHFALQSRAHPLRQYLPRCPQPVARTPPWRIPTWNMTRWTVF